MTYDTTDIWSCAALKHTEYLHKSECVVKVKSHGHMFELAAPKFNI